MAEARYAVCFASLAFFSLVIIAVDSVAINGSLEVAECANGAPDKSEFLVYLQKISDERVRISLKDLQSTNVVSIDIILSTDQTMFLSYFPGYLVGVYEKNLKYYIFHLRYRIGQGGSVDVVGTRNPWRIQFPNEYGRYVSAITSDYVGLRVFMSGGRNVRMTKIVYYEPESQTFNHLYTLKQPVFDMAYYPIRKILYLLAIHLLILDIEYSNGNIFVSYDRQQLVPICNPILGVLSFGVQQRCEGSFPFLHLISKPYARHRWYEWKIMNGETGTCLSDERNTSLPLMGSIRTLQISLNWFAVLYLNGSTFVSRRADSDLSSHEGSTMMLAAESVQAMTGASPDMFNLITEQCFSPKSQTLESLIATGVTVINSTSMQVAIFYSANMFPGVCANLSFPSLKVHAVYRPGQFCENDGCSGTSSPNVVNEMAHNGMLAFNNLLPGNTYNVTISAAGAYFSQWGVRNVDKNITLFIPDEH